MKYETIQDYYKDLDLFCEEIKTEGKVDIADRMHNLLHKVAWTTGSELLGELIICLEKLGSETLSSDLEDRRRDLLKTAKEAADFR